MTRSRAVRSLRRRLWRALQEEDVDTAIRAYTATRADYEAWLVEEELQREEERQREEEARLARQKEKRATQHAALKNLGLLRFGRSTCNIQAQSRRRSKQDIALSVQTLEEPISTEGDHPLLQREMGPSDVFVADDFRSPHDSYEQEQFMTEQHTYKNHYRTSKSKGFRLAGFRAKDELDANEKDDEDPGEDELFTTPLHEAARLGSGKLVRLFLEHGGRPNVRNGKQRTALHMAAGGLTGEEQGLLLALLNEMPPKADRKVVEHDVGIRAPCMDAPESTQETEQHSGGAKKAAMAISRFLKLGSHSLEKDNEAVEQKKILPPFDANRLYKLTTQRMDAFLAIMAWIHPEDGSAASGEGPSINSVDGRGRTALHYAAELGRSDICTAIVSSFGAMLTIVDESSRTPCELAGERLHDHLAAQLEARALLYFDPSGVEDELLASILADERNDGSASRNRLVPPFSWFETLDSDTVRQKRNEITETATVKMQDILNSCQVQKEANEVMFNYNVNDSLDSVPQADIDAVACIGKPIQNNERVSDGLGTDALVEDTVDHTSTPQINALDESSRYNDNSAKNLATSSSESAPDESSNRHENPAVKLDPSGASEYTLIRESLQESHVERFLTFHGWRVEHALAEFRKDPATALGDAGVPIVMHKSLGKSEELTTQTCLICFDEFAPGAPEWKELRICKHGFCVKCLGDYIANCVNSKASGMTVVCPHHQCTVPLTQSELQSLAPALWESLLGVADENFVASSEDLKFCPHPGCTGVVRRLVPAIVSEEGFDHDIIDISGAVCVMLPEGAEEKDAPLTYEGVRDKRYVMSKGSTQPHMAHRFCFACGAESVHWPVPCDQLEEWKKKVREEVADEDEGENAGNYQDVAQRLWMKTNTRPCPQCKVPIEKDEGCNHMTCTNRHCRYEFCWICRKDWKLHNTETGGFFRCNRWQAEESHELYDTPPPATEPRPEGDAAETAEQDGYGTAIHATRVAFKRANEMNRFLHHFRRWSAHSESAALEWKMANTVCSRLAPVVEAAIDFSGSSDFNFGGKGLSFVHAAFTELLECRSFLQHSYAFAFFRYPTLYYFRRNRVVKMRQREMATFEQFQSELEMMTEQMSDIVARTHLRATQTQIMFLTCEAAEKRRNLSNFLIAILNDEREEERENTGRENDALGHSIPPPIDISGMLERLSRVPVRNEHDDIDSDDSGVIDPYPVRRQRREIEEEAAMQEALQASLQAFIAESQSHETEGNTEEAEGPSTEWSCEACTYMNSRGRTCAMCGTARD